MEESIRSGFLLKKGQYNTAWKCRWCVLVPNKLLYYKDKEQTGRQSPLGMIPLQLSIVRTCTEDVGREFCFEIITKDRVFKLVALSHQEMNDWIQSLLPYTLLHTENDCIKQAEDQIKLGATKHFFLFEKQFDYDKYTENEW